MKKLLSYKQVLHQTVPKSISNSVLVALLGCTYAFLVAPTLEFTQLAYIINDSDMEWDLPAANTFTVSNPKEVYTFSLTVIDAHMDAQKAGHSAASTTQGSVNYYATLDENGQVSSVGRDPVPTIIGTNADLVTYTGLGGESLKNPISSQVFKESVGSVQNIKPSLVIVNDDTEFADGVIDVNPGDPANENAAKILALEKARATVEAARAKRYEAQVQVSVAEQKLLVNRQKQQKLQAKIIETEKRMESLMIEYNNANPYGASLLGSVLLGYTMYGDSYNYSMYNTSSEYSAYSDPYNYSMYEDTYNYSTYSESSDYQTYNDPYEYSTYEESYYYEDPYNGYTTDYSTYSESSVYPMYSDPFEYSTYSESSESSSSSAPSYYSTNSETSNSSESSLEVPTLTVLKEVSDQYAKLTAEAEQLAEEQAMIQQELNTARATLDDATTEEQAAMATLETLEESTSLPAFAPPSSSAPPAFAPPSSAPPFSSTPPAFAPPFSSAPPSSAPPFSSTPPAFAPPFSSAPPSSAPPAFAPPFSLPSSSSSSSGYYCMYTDTYVPSSSDCYPVMPSSSSSSSGYYCMYTDTYVPSSSDCYPVISSSSSLHNSGPDIEDTASSSSPCDMADPTCGAV